MRPTEPTGTTATTTRETDEPSPIRELLLRSHATGYSGAAYLLGVFNEERGELAEAEHWYTLAADAGHPAGQVMLSDLCSRQLRLDEAEALLSDLDSDDEAIAERLAEIAQLREEGVLPEQDLRRLPELRERAEAGDIQASYAYGKMLYEWGGASARWMIHWYEEAEPYLRKAWEEGREEEFGTETAGYYGLVLHRTGRHAQAVELLRVAAESWFEDVMPRYDVNDLDMVSRMVNPEKELAAAEEALAAG